VAPVTKTRFNPMSLSDPKLQTLNYRAILSFT
jgi:hypothetical protein